MPSTTHHHSFVGSLMNCPFERLIENMTVAQFADTAGLSVGALVALLLAHHGTRRVAREQGCGRDARRETGIVPPNSGAGWSASVYDTRTQAGRRALDEAIMDFVCVCERPVRATEVRTAIGGTPRQVRARLAVLVAEGRLDQTGRASGTRYSRTGPTLVENLASSEHSG